MIDFDEIAVVAASRAHDSTAFLDPNASLPAFQRAAEHRRRTRIALSVASVALAVGTLLWAVQAPGARRAEPVRPLPSPTPAIGARLLAGSVNLTVPVTYPSSSVLYRREPGAGGDVARFDRDPDMGGITIFERAIPVRDAAGHRDHTAGNTARELAVWLARRPFLIDTRIVPVSVGGRPAWRVESRLPPNLHGFTLQKDGRTIEVPPVLRSGDAYARYGPAAGDTTFVDVPGAGVVAIWTWNYYSNLGAATEPAMRAFVAGLQFGG